MNYVPNTELEGIFLVIPVDQNVLIYELHKVKIFFFSSLF